jgi:hypothetical protein
VVNVQRSAHQWLLSDRALAGASCLVQRDEMSVAIVTEATMRH